MWLLQRCSATLVATHTYVNPVVAVLLGWALAGESLTLRSSLAPRRWLLRLSWLAGTASAAQPPKKALQDGLCLLPPAKRTGRRDRLGKRNYFAFLALPWSRTATSPPPPAPRSLLDLATLVRCPRRDRTAGGVGPLTPAACVGDGEDGEAERHGGGALAPLWRFRPDPQIRGTPRGHHGICSRPVRGVARSLRDRARARRGRDGDRLPRPRRQAPPTCRAQGAPPRAGRGDRRQAVPAARSRPPPTCSIPTSSRSTTRARWAAPPTTSCPTSRASRCATGSAGEAAPDRGRRADRDRGGERARLRPPQGRDPPRHQAREHPAARGPGAGGGLRHRAGR